MIYVLYGQPGSGKTTLGKLLAEHLNTPFIIDGDEFRKMFYNDAYDKSGREDNIKAANAVATYLNKKAKSNDWACVYLRDSRNSIKGLQISEQTDVVMCLVNPYEHLREELKVNNEDQVVEILLTSERELRKEYHVKDFEAGNPKHAMDTDVKLKDSWDQLKGLIG